MAVQKGVSALLKIDTTGLGVFADVGGARVVGASFNNQPVDATSAASTGQWRQLVDAAGIISMDISFSGVFQDDSQDTLLDTKFRGRLLTDFQVVVPDFGTYEGSFIITNYSFNGSHDDVVTFELALQSGGEITFTAA